MNSIKAILLLSFLPFILSAQESLPTPAMEVEKKVISSLELGDLETLLNLDQEIESIADDFNYSESSLFQSKTQLMGFVHALRSMNALRNDDMTQFEIEVKETFWLSPQLIDLFGLKQVVEEYHAQKLLEERMANMQIDMNLEIQLADTSKHTLKSLVSGKKALLIDFWASWCGPCMQLMPELKKKAATLTDKNIVVIGLNTEKEGALDKANQVKDKFEIDFPWAIETGETRLSEIVQIQTIPQMILLSPEGKILFQGHPQDPKLGPALERLSE